MIIINTKLSFKYFSNIQGGVKIPNKNYSPLHENFTNRKGFKKFKSYDWMSLEDQKSVEEEGLKWADGKFEGWSSKLTKREKEVLKRYTEGSREINEYLRANNGDKVDVDNDDLELTDEDFVKLDKLNEKIDMIDSAIDKSLLNQSLYLFRRTNIDHFFTKKEQVEINPEIFNDEGKINSSFFKLLLDKFNNDKINTFNSYVSTSIVQDPSGLKEGWSTNSFPFLFKIAAEKGSKMAYVSAPGIGFEYFKNQAEIVLPRNQKYQYKKFSIVKINGKSVIQVKINLLPN